MNKLTLNVRNTKNSKAEKTCYTPTHRDAGVCARVVTFPPCVNNVLINRVCVFFFTSVLPRSLQHVFLITSRSQHHCRLMAAPHN